MALLLVLSALPALSEIRSDQALAPPVFGPTTATQESARVASDGTNFFAVWLTRTTSSVLIIGGRLSPAGELLDRPSILIASGAAATLGYPDVVFVGGNFLVVYPAGTSVVARRFTREGRPVDSQPVVISNSNMAGWLATNGKNVFLPTAQNRFRLLAADGTPLGAERVIPNAGLGSFSVASNGDRYLIAYAVGTVGGAIQPPGLFFLLDTAGELLKSKSIPLPDPLFMLTITAASNGSSFLLHMATGRNFSNSTAGPVGCISIDADGNVGTLHTLDEQRGNSVAATWSGSEYTLVWGRRSTIAGQPDTVVGMRVNATGEPLDTEPVMVNSSSMGDNVAFAAATNGRETLIISGESNRVFRQYRATAAIFNSLPRIDTEPATRRRVLIASSAAEQAEGSIASNGTVSLVAWREHSAEQTVIRAAFIAADGQVGPPMDLGESSMNTKTAAASNGRDFFVVYFDSQFSLVARRVTLEGVHDSNPIRIPVDGSSANSLAAGWSGQAYVIVSGGQNATISGISPDGTVIAGPQKFSAPFSYADTVAIQCAATACGATWHSKQLSEFPDFYTVNETNTLAVTDRWGNVVSRLPITDGIGPTPALSIPSADGRSLFVYSSGKGTFAGRITLAGVVLDAPGVNGGVRVMNSATSFALQPVAVVNGGLYFIEPVNADATNSRLYWTRIEPEPTPHVTTIIDLHQNVTPPLALNASARNTYFLFSAGEDDANLMAPRLFLRTLATPDPQTSTPRKRAAR